METWNNDIPMTQEEKLVVRLLRNAGCRCTYPLLGYIPNQGPRCRMCGIEVFVEEKEKNEQIQRNEK